MKRGKFITFEGGEGSGKSTQARCLAEALRATGLEVVLTREPGGTARAEAVRALLFDRSLAPPSPLTEALLFNAARADHLDAAIRPALARGAWVICDRFIDSTRAYQGVAGGLSREEIDLLERLTVGDTRPDLTLILDLDPAQGLERTRARQKLATPDKLELDPFEARDRIFHERLRRAYLDIAAAEGNRCVVIDGSGCIDIIFQSVRLSVAAHFGLGPL